MVLDSQKKTTVAFLTPGHMLYMIVTHSAPVTPDVVR